MLVLETEDSDPIHCFLLAYLLQMQGFYVLDWLRNRKGSFSFSSADSFATKSWNIMRKIRALQVLLGNNVLGPRNMLPLCLHKLHRNCNKHKLTFICTSDSSTSFRGQAKALRSLNSCPSSAVFLQAAFFVPLEQFVQHVRFSFKHGKPANLAYLFLLHVLLQLQN